MPRAFATWPRGHVLAAIFPGLIIGLLAGCFTAPADAVLFACTPEAPDCPTDYTCADDGCCHRDGSDIAANYGACGLGGPATGPLASSTDVSPTSSTGAPTTTGTSTTDPSTSASTGADTSTTSATDASSTSASTGP